MSNKKSAFSGFFSENSNFFLFLPVYLSPVSFQVRKLSVMLAQE